MEDIINSFIEFGMGGIIDKRTAHLLLKDEIYQQDFADLKDLEGRVEELDIEKMDKFLIEDYIACYETVQSRARELTYIAGIRDTVKFLNHIGLLKN